MSRDNNDKIKVLITDDHSLFRTGIKSSLSHYTDIEFIGEAENGAQLLNLVRSVQPDIILLDIQMPVMNGIETLPEIRKILPDAKVIMLTMHDDESMISKLMEIGANSYLIKNSDSETIYKAIKTVHTKEFFFTEHTNKAMLLMLRNKRKAEQHLSDEANLSEKELQVLKLMCDEKSTKEIADIVEISPRTVEAIRDRLKIKTGVKSTAGLILYAIKHGLV